MTSTTAEWLLEISGLTVGTSGGTDVVAQGHLLAAQVRAAAAGHLAASPCGGRDDCGPDCVLNAIDGGPAACRLARRLASTPAADPAPATEGALASVVDASTVPPPPPGGQAAERAATMYVQAVRAAATAVFHCRHAHAVGECWFSVDGAPLCGDVLAAAHRLGA